MKKFLKAFMVVIATTVLLASCGGASSKAFDPENLITEEEATKLFADAGSLKGKSIEVRGQVYDEPKIVEGVLRFAVIQDIENYDKIVAVQMDAEEAAPLSKSDFVIVQGVILGAVAESSVYEYTVSKGAPEVQATTAEKTDYTNAIAPTQHTIEVGETQDQHGLKVTIDKIEFSDVDTRVFISVANDSTADSSIYSHSVKLVHAQKTYEESYAYRADYEELDTTLVPGTKTNGIIALAPMDYENLSEIKVILGAYLSDYKLDVEDFTFIIK